VRIQESWVYTSEQISIMALS